MGFVGSDSRRKYVRLRPATTTHSSSSSSSTSAVQQIEVNSDPLCPAIFLTNKEIFRESHEFLYKYNTFVLQLDSALRSIVSIHQRSRSKIQHIRLTIPTHHDILEGFQDLVRLGLRYCWHLKTLTIHMPYMFPDDRGGNSASTTNVYANAFHILRWLPKSCEVILEGNVHKDIQAVVATNAEMAKQLDERAYQRRQHQQET